MADLNPATVTPDIKLHPTVPDLTGKRFGRLLIIEFAGINHRRQSTWRCLCDCGRDHTTNAGTLGFGSSRSCGCAQREKARLSARPLAERFWAKVQIEKNERGCWLWTGATFEKRGGYGSFNIGASRADYAHRVSYRLMFGDFPDGTDVLHHCDNPPCVSPAHLFLGTAADNSDDMVAKGRQAQGERVSSSKLSRNSVREIRNMYRQGGLTLQQVGERFGVAVTRVSNIVNRKTWKQVE